MSLSSHPKMSSSSANSSTNSTFRISFPLNEHTPKTLCYCNVVAALRTSWTPKNPSRRFFNCRSGRCKFWEWYDREITDWERSVINYFIQRINELEEKRAVGDGNSFSLVSELTRLQYENARLKHENERIVENQNQLRIEVGKLSERAKGAYWMILVFIFVVVIQFIVIYY